MRAFQKMCGQVVCEESMLAQWACELNSRKKCSRKFLNKRGEKREPNIMTELKKIKKKWKKLEEVSFETQMRQQHIHSLDFRENKSCFRNQKKQILTKKRKEHEETKEEKAEEDEQN
jgi:hypothetical protein